MRNRRHQRIRRKVVGTAERPRLAVSRSLKHIAGQIIDDERGVTLVGISSRYVDGAAAPPAARDAATAPEATAPAR